VRDTSSRKWLLILLTSAWLDFILGDEVDTPLGDVVGDFDELIKGSLEVAMLCGEELWKFFEMADGKLLMVRCLGWL
jgi:hypothetical protein